jgi:hypothetical protein
MEVQTPSRNGITGEAQAWRRVYQSQEDGMSKSIRSFPEHERFSVAHRRINSGERGLGYWAAVDYFEAVKRQEEKAKKNPIAKGAIG